MSLARHALIAATVAVAFVMGAAGLRNYVRAHICVQPAALAWCAR